METGFWLNVFKNKNLAGFQPFFGFPQNFNKARGRFLGRSLSNLLSLHLCDRMARMDSLLDQEGCRRLMSVQLLASTVTI
jgi:hypothetical protein